MMTRARMNCHMMSPWLLPTGSPHLFKPLLHACRIECFWIKLASPPLELFVLLVLGIGDCPKKLSIADNSSHIFWRASSFSFQAQRIFAIILRSWAALKSDPVI